MFIHDTIPQPFFLFFFQYFKNYQLFEENKLHAIEFSNRFRKKCKTLSSCLEDEKRLADALILFSQKIQHTTSDEILSKLFQFCMKIKQQSN